MACAYFVQYFHANSAGYAFRVPYGNAGTCPTSFLLWVSVCVCVCACACVLPGLGVSILCVFDVCMCACLYVALRLLFQPARISFQIASAVRSGVVEVTATNAAFAALKDGSASIERTAKG